MSLSRSASPDGPTPVPPWPPRPPRSSAPTPFPPASASAVAAPSPHPGSRPDLPPAPSAVPSAASAPAPDAQTDPEPDRRRLAQDRPRRDAEISGAWYPGSPEHAAPVARLPTAEPEKTSPRHHRRVRQKPSKSHRASPIAPKLAHNRTLSLDKMGCQKSPLFARRSSPKRCLNISRKCKLMRPSNVHPMSPANHLLKLRAIILLYQ